MARKVILVVLDGLAYETAEQCMGFMQGLREQGAATLYKMECELPSMSRPLYETIATGVVPAQSGIVHNHIVRLSNQESIFSLARKAGLVTAAAAYHWFSELYNCAPYNAVRDRFTNDPEQLIQHGMFYSEDHYPDSHLYLDAEFLRKQFDPDFLLIHPMNIDDAGHKSGFDSAHYRNATRMTDTHLSEHLVKWVAEGYQVLVTADHGMNNDHSHGGILPSEREIPLFVLGNSFTHDTDSRPKQVDLCGIVCSLLGIKNHNKPITEGFVKEDFVNESFVEGVVA